MSDSAGALLAEDRRVLTMEGADARRVLQGIVTNDVERMAPDRLVYAALLTPQGKYLFDFFLFPDGEAVMLDVAADRAAALAERLSMYCLRRDARVTGEAPLEVALVWGAEPAGGAGTRLFSDPRDAALGWRVYAPDARAAVAGLPPAAPGDYTALRVRHGVPESGIELVPEQTFILEAGLERLGGIDFRKGCYVGQEVTARMKHKTELRKRLVRVAVEGEAPAGTPVTADGRPAGTLFSQADGRGLAHLRLDRAGGAMEAGAARLTLAEGP
ncbi:MAG TPA: folate-binding protein [Thermohalobaculum sp.]|nr:folate-binding protein [Thermohalobaculum sp.]